MSGSRITLLRPTTTLDPPIADGYACGRADSQVENACGQDAAVKDNAQLAAANGMDHRIGDQLAQAQDRFVDGVHVDARCRESANSGGGGSRSRETRPEWLAKQGSLLGSQPARVANERVGRGTCPLGTHVLTIDLA